MAAVCHNRTVMKQHAVQIFSMGLHADLAAGPGPEGFAQWIEAAVQQARQAYEEGCHRLLVFPEYCTLPLVHDAVSLQAYGTASFALFSQVAVSEAAYVLACGPIVEGGSMYNQASLFSPMGDEVLRERKRNLTREERSLGLEAGALPVRAVTLPFGTVGISVCLDAFSAHHRRRLAECGVELLLVPSANSQPWRAPAEGSGIWQPLEWMGATVGAVSDPGSPIRLVVNPMLRGGAKFGREFDGQSGIVRRSSSFYRCPYIGVEREVNAEFLHCGPDIGIREHDIGCALRR